MASLLQEFQLIFLRWPIVNTHSARKLHIEYRSQGAKLLRDVQRTEPQCPKDPIRKNSCSVDSRATVNEYLFMEKKQEGGRTIFAEGRAKYSRGKRLRKTTFTGSRTQFTQTQRGVDSICGRSSAILNCGKREGNSNFGQKHREADHI